MLSLALTYWIVQTLKGVRGRQGTGAQKPGFLAKVGLGLSGNRGPKSYYEPSRTG